MTEARRKRGTTSKYLPGKPMTTSTYRSRERIATSEYRLGMPRTMTIANQASTMDNYDSDNYEWRLGCKRLRMTIRTHMVTNDSSRATVTEDGFERRLQKMISKSGCKRLIPAVEPTVKTNASCCANVPNEYRLLSWRLRRTSAVVPTVKTNTNGRVDDWGKYRLLSWKAMTSFGIRSAAKIKQIWHEKPKKKLLAIKNCTQGTYGAKILPMWVVVSNDIAYKTTYDIDANALRLSRKPRSKIHFQDEIQA